MLEPIVTHPFDQSLFNINLSISMLSIEEYEMYYLQSA